MIRQTGIVKYSDAARGFGYIQREGQSDLFFLHRHVLGDTARPPRKGDTVSFDEVKGQRGMQASQVCNHDDPVSQAEYDAWMTPARIQARKEDAQARERIASGKFTSLNLR